MQLSNTKGACFMLQFTNETLAEQVATLTRVVVRSVEKEVDQNGNNLNKIAGIFSKIANQVTLSNMILDHDVSNFSSLPPHAHACMFLH